MADDVVNVVDVVIVVNVVDVVVVVVNMNTWRYIFHFHAARLSRLKLGKTKI